MNYGRKTMRMIDGGLGAMGLCRSSEVSGFGSFMLGCGIGLIAGGALRRYGYSS